MAVAAKGTLVAGVVAAETVAAVALCIMGTFRRGTMEAMNRRVQHYGKRSGIFWHGEYQERQAIVMG